jgi:hypothetical protein
MIRVLDILPEEESHHAKGQEGKKRKKRVNLQKETSLRSVCVS